MGRTVVPELAPGTDSYLGIHQEDVPGRSSRDCISLGWRNLAGNSGYWAGPVHDWPALQVIGVNPR